MTSYSARPCVVSRSANHDRTKESRRGFMWFSFAAMRSLMLTRLRSNILPLLPGPRLRRHKTCEAVVHNELAVVFTAMFDEAVCNVENARFLVIEINNLRRQAFFAFRLDGGCAVVEGFLDERNDVGLGLVLVALGIFCCRRLLPHDGIGEVVA